MDWLFQANPKRYDLRTAIATGTDRNWAMNQGRKEVSVGDRIYFWESGPDAQLVAVGHVASPVYERDESEFGRYIVDVSYDYTVEPPLSREDILACPPPLGSYKAFGWLMGTNHAIRDASVVAALDQTLAPRLRPLTPVTASNGEVRESQIDLDKAIKNAERQTGHALAQAIAAMDPIAFEWLVRAVLAELGYVDIEVTKPSNDKGVDLRARLVSKGVTSINMAVQVKRTPSVDRPTVQKLRGALSAHESGLIVTSGRFTPAAEEEAKDPTKTPIALMNGSRFVNLLLEFGIGARQKTYKVYSIEPSTLLLENLKERAGEAVADELGDE
jgi:hypothetical protein